MERAVVTESSRGAVACGRSRRHGYSTSDTGIHTTLTISKMPENIYKHRGHAYLNCIGELGSRGSPILRPGYQRE